MLYKDISISWYIRACTTAAILCIFFSRHMHAHFENGRGAFNSYLRRNRKTCRRYNSMHLVGVFHKCGTTDGSHASRNRTERNSRSHHTSSHSRTTTQSLRLSNVQPAHRAPTSPRALCSWHRSCCTHLCPQRADSTPQLLLLSMLS